jgi:LEA14-like dessication related protein
MLSKKSTVWISSCLVCWLGLSFLTSCAHVARTFGLAPKAPKIELNDVKIKSFSFTSVEMDVTFDVLNVDSSSLDVCELAAEFRYENEVIGKLNSSACVKIDPEKHVMVTVPVTIAAGEVIRRGVAMAKPENKPKFKVLGSLKLKTWFGYVPLSIERSLKQ